MELSSRQLVALGAPVLVTYLTWSAVSGEVAPPPAANSAAIATASASKRPQIAPLSRNPFAPASITEAAADLGAFENASNDPEQARAALTLDGTVVTGRWRMAIINGERVFEGQSYRGRLRLEKVTTDSVTLVPAAGQPIQLRLDITRPQPPAAAKSAATKGANPAAAKQAVTADKNPATSETVHGGSAGEAEHGAQRNHGNDDGKTSHGSSTASGARY